MGVKGEILFISKTTKSCIEWTRIWMAKNQSWCASGFNSWSFIFMYYLIYFDDLSNNLGSNVKLLADYTLMFSVVGDLISTSQKLKKLVIAPISGKCPSIQIHKNKVKRYFFHKLYHLPLLLNNSTV